MISRKLQIVLILVFALILIWTIRQVKKRRLDLRYTLSWLFLEIALLIFSAFPGLLNGLARLMGIYSPMNMLFFCGFAFSLIIIYTLTAAISRQSEEIKQLTQKIALMEKQKEEKKDES